MPDILGQTLRPTPIVIDQSPRTRRCIEASPGVNWRATREPRRDLDHGLVDQHRHRVEVASMCFHPEALGFHRQGTTPGEWIVEGRQPVWIEEFRGAWVICVVYAGPPPASQDLLASALKDFLVRRVLPSHEFFDQSEQTRPFAPSCLLGREPIRVLRRIVDHLSEDDGTRSRQRSSRPPKMKSAGMAVPDRFFAPRSVVDRVEWKRNLDEFLALPDGRMRGDMGIHMGRYGNMVGGGTVGRIAD